MAIQTNIAAASPHTQYIARPKDDLGVLGAGAKALSLQTSQRGDMPVPPWFVILPEALTSGMSLNQRDEFLTTREPAKVKYYAQRLVMSPRFGEELQEAIKHLIGGATDAFLAVRMSPREEGPGQTYSPTDAQPFLYVRPDDVVIRAIELWQGVYTEEVLFRRLERGEPLVAAPPAVIVQKMVRADVSGIAYGGDPANGRRGVVVIAAVYGLGTSMVTGESDADSYEVSRDDQIVRRSVACKQTAHVLDQLEGSGVRPRMVIPSQQEMPALTDSQILAVADLAWRVNSMRHRPQQVEWAIEAGTVALLQTKPLPILQRLADPDAVEVLWDRQVTAASYPNAVTPMTFSVARWMESAAYLELCRSLGMGDAQLRARGDLFDRVIGRIEGYIYSNQSALAEMLDVLPQPRWRREQLSISLGIAATSSGAAGARQDKSSAVSSSDPRDEPLHLDPKSVLTMWLAEQRHAAKYEGMRHAFAERLSDALEPCNKSLERLRPDELGELLRSLQREVIDRWDAPATNDALAAIAYDLLGQLTKNWCDDASGALKTDLVADLEDLPGTDALHRLRQIARALSKSDGLLAALKVGDAGVIDRLMSAEQNESLRNSIAEFVERYGDLAPDGLAIEASSLRDNPLPLLNALLTLAEAPDLLAATPDPRLLPTTAVAEANITAAERARERIAGQLRDKSARRGLFYKVLDLARHRLRDRELYRYDRVRIVAAVRRVLLELGRRLFAVDVIDSPRHILYLELDEVFGFIEGTSTCTDLRSLIGIRWREHAAYRKQPAPPETLTTHGVVYVGNDGE